MATISICKSAISIGMLVLLVLLVGCDSSKRVEDDTSYKIKAGIEVETPLVGVGAGIESVKTDGSIEDPLSNCKQDCVWVGERNTTVIYPAEGSPDNDAEDSVEGQEAPSSQVLAVTGNANARESRLSIYEDYERAKENTAKIQETQPLQVLTVTGNANVRESPVIEAGNVVAYGYPGDVVTALERKQKGSDGKPWTRVRFQGGAEGWVSNEFLSER